MALGAQRRDVIWMVVRQAWILVALGIAAGIPAAIAAGRVASNQMAGLLFRQPAADPAILAAATVAPALVATAAACLPSRRASRVDPIRALRTE